MAATARAGKVGARYARALVDVVARPQPPETPDAVERQLRNFLELTRESPELRTILESPAVPAPKKKALVERLGERIGLSRVTKNFLFVLLDHRRIALLESILPAFRALLDQRLGLVEAQVTAAAPVGDADRALVEDALRRLTGRQVRLSYAVDPGLIGGAVTRIGSTIYDASVREHLRVLREKLSSE